MNKVIIYTDGGCRGNQHNGANVGGIGVLLKYGKYEKEICKGFRNTTNNQMEIKAVITGLKALNRTNLPIEIRSDSAYVVNCINQKWYEKWMNNGWVTSSKKPVENRELWIELIDLIKQCPFISFTKVKGHSDCEGNNRADALANKAMDELRLV